MITSRQNPQVQYIKSLQQKKNRDRDKKFLIEGWRFVEEALTAGVPKAAKLAGEGGQTGGSPVEMVIFSASAQDDARQGYLTELAADRSIPVLYMADQVFKAIVETEQPQGVAALIRQWEPDIDDALRQCSNPLLLVVDGVRDPGNLGTVIRTADAAGAAAVVLMAGTADLFNGKTLRSTMGSIFHLPVQKDMMLSELTILLEAHGLPLIAADLAGREAVYNVPMTGPLAIAVGSEAAGISEELRQAAAQLVSIPMPGQAESLNVSVAAGILLFEAVRQRTVHS